MPKKKEKILNIEKCSYQASQYKTELWLFLCCSSNWNLDWFLHEIQHFVEQTPKNCFKSFIQSAADARRKGDENPNSSVVA